MMLTNDATIILLFSQSEELHRIRIDLKFCLSLSWYCCRERLCQSAYE